MSSVGTEIGYVGWAGNNNLGDDAIYKAIDREVDTFDLKPSKYAIDASTTLLGGGTILPLIYRDGSAFHFEDRAMNVALGVGVAEPAFENRRLAPLDLRWASGTRGIDLDAAFERAGVPGKIARYVGNQIPGMIVSGVYCYDEHYRRAGETLDTLTVRGPRSREVLNEYGVSSEIVGDTALLLEPDGYRADASDKVVVSLRTPNTDRKWTHDRRYVEHVLEFCQSLAAEVETVFLPLQPSDIPLHVNLARRVENGRWVDYTSVVNVDKALNEIASAEVVIGEKLHANVFAACCHTPFVSLEYAPKNEDFAASMGMSELNVRIGEVTESRLLELYETAREYSTSQVRSKVKTYRTRLRRCLGELKRDTDRLRE